MFLSIEPDPEGLPERVFQRHLDTYLEWQIFDPDILPQMNYKQQFIIYQIKKAYARINDRNTEFVPETKYTIHEDNKY